MQQIGIITILFIVSGITYFVISHLRKTPQKIERPVLEKGESWRTWLIGRTMRINDSRRAEDNFDSREFLESLGFRILGVADEMRYAAEAPKGWERTPDGYEGHIYITDQYGVIRFWMFESHTSDDLRAFIYESYEKSKRVLGKKAKAADA